MRKSLYLFIILLLLLPQYLGAKVLRVEIESREIILDGKEFGRYGSYELLSGRIWFSTDPGNLFNSRIVDLHLADRDEEGRVISVANFQVLQPVDQSLARGLALVEVSNRGGKFSLRYFNRGRGGRLIDAARADDFGDGLLMREGLTVIWIGWQFDVPSGDDYLKLDVPMLKSINGEPLEGLVRSDWTVDENVKSLSLGHRQQTGYPVSDPGDERTILTVRAAREDIGVVVPREKWRFGRISDNGVFEADNGYICSDEGFEAGKVYELVYMSDTPVPVGLGLSAIRDIISYSKYDDRSPFRVKKGIAVGVSQTGRFLRHFLYQGFNTDEEGRMAYDGMYVITAGAGRGSFNHRFGQPSRDAHRYSAFFYPTDIFPFTGRVTRDYEQWKSDGILAHIWDESHTPKIFYCNTGYEYWGRAASLIHTDPDALFDIDPLPLERIYALSSGQHYVGPNPTERNRIEGTLLYRGNPLDFSVNYRSLLLELCNWVDKGNEPPESAFPRIDNGTLAGNGEISWPDIQGLVLPFSPHTAYLADYGPRWADGIIDYQPPLLTKPFPSLVAMVDSIGNDLGGIRNTEITVPLGTYLPWNVRTGFAGGEDELTDFTGTFIPLQTGTRKYRPDSRPLVNDLYASREDYLARVRAEAEKLVEEGYMLSEDIEYVITKSARLWDSLGEINK